MQLGQPSFLLRNAWRTRIDQSLCEVSMRTAASPHAAAVRRRGQTAMNRRFCRAKHGAEHRFAARLREQVDLPRVAKS